MILVVSGCQIKLMILIHDFEFFPGVIGYFVPVCIDPGQAAMIHLLAHVEVFLVVIPRVEHSGDIRSMALVIKPVQYCAPINFADGMGYFMGQQDADIPVPQLYLSCSYRLPVQYCFLIWLDWPQNIVPGLAR